MDNEAPSFLERVQGDICGPNPHLVDQIMEENLYLNYLYFTTGNEVGYHIVFVHTQNGLAVSLIK